jgi:hypothetical protein
LNQDKQSLFKYILLFLISITCIADIVTFFYGRLYDFEINPLFILLKSSIGIAWAIGIVIGYKILVNAGISYAVYTYKPKNTHIWAYILVYTSLMIILVQGFGAYSNLNVKHNYDIDPINVKPMTTEASYSLMSVATTVYYACTLMNLLAFFVYEKIFRTNNIHKS